MTDGSHSNNGAKPVGKNRVVILVGFAEALSAPETVWSLLDGGFEVLAFARKGRSSALRYSRFVTCQEIRSPESDLHGSLADLQALMARIQAEALGARLVFFPLDDKAVWLGSRLEPNDSWLMIGPTGHQAELALRKDVQTRMAKEAGFNVPETALVRNADEVLQFAAQQSFPLILKAADCIPEYQGKVYSCRKWICANPVELQRAIEEWKERVPLLAQAFVTGVGEGVFGLAAPEGVRAWSGHHRVRMMNPQGSGSSACGSQYVPEEIKANVAVLLKNAGWRGLFMVEMLRDDSGKLWFVELNGRPWGSMALCRRQGLEYPAWHVELALDEHAQAGCDGEVTRDIVCRHAGREFMHLLFVLKGAKSHALTKWPSFWKSLRDVVQFRGKDGVYNWRRDDPKVFLADFYFTVHDNVFKSRN